VILQAPVSRLIRLILEKKDLTFLAHEGISEGDFQPKQAQTAIEWVREFYNKWEKFPEVSTVKQELNIDLPDEVEEESFVIRTAKDYFRSKKLQSIIEKAAISLEARDPQGAEAILKQVLDLESTTNLGHSFRQTGIERYERYEDGKHTKNSGILTPWPSLNEQIMGYMPASITTLMALSNTGKTWLGIINSAHMLNQGYRVALISMEDSLSLIENRLDSLYYKINNRDLNKHALRMGEEAKWRDGLHENTEGDGDVFIYTSKQVNNVFDLSAIVDTVKPDVLIVDAAYRLQAKGIEMGWKTSEVVMDQLKDLMEVKQIPIILTVQQDPELMKKAKSKQERMYSTRGGKFWGIGSNVVVELAATEDQRIMGTATLTVCKNKSYIPDGSESTGEIDIHWDLKTMDFHELAEDDVLEEIQW